MKYSLALAIKQVLLAGSTALYTASILAAVGQQNPPPGPGQVPDYFGVVPNYANSPLPVLTKTLVNTGSAVQPGVGASTTVTLGTGGTITSIKPAPLTGTGSGYVTPKVEIFDQGVGVGASIAVATTSTSGGALSGTYTISNGGSDCTLGLPVAISGNGTAKVSALGAGNSVQAIQITNPGSGYSGNVSFIVDCVTNGGVGAMNASGTLNVTPGTPGQISSITVNQGGANYSPNAKVVFSDPNRFATGNTDAVAHVNVDANGSITSIVKDNLGTGYTATTTAKIEDVATGTGAKATATAQKVGGVFGVITAINITDVGSGYRNPLIAITDANVGAAGQGAVLVATTYDYSNDQMTDKIMDVQVLYPGSGYSAGTTVNITGGPGSSGAMVTPIIVNGAIVGIEGIDIPDPTSPTGYSRDPNFTGLNLGSGFKAPIAGTGIRKFVDSLPRLNAANTLNQQLPVAVPDTTTFPGSDYYEIAETEYLHQFHRDLPTSNVRGYKQLNVPAGHAARVNHYLGPVIVARKNRPVRVKLVNQLSKSNDTAGFKGKLPIPVDTTYMGADDVNDTDNRTALHLHGGNTPWISDGTPRQWVKPAGEPKGVNKGESARDVPDMFFVNGNVVPACSATVTSSCSKPAGQPQNLLPVGATNNPGDGALTFYFTNEQSARMMFYHDHTEGTTRLNVYAGLAAGYILQDPTELAMISGGTAHDAAMAMGYSSAEAAKYDNVTSFAADTLPPLTDTIPLVIQEKTFVPDDTAPVLNFYGPFKSQLNSQDPTWRWGSGTLATPYKGNGDLWVPHVFMPNQNPGDVSGANSVGRWDYGAWFWPPFANLQNLPIVNPYYDQFCDTTTQYCEGQYIPGVPNGSLQSVMSNGVPGGVHDSTRAGAITESPSGTPEAFNDTPIVNGAAYPYIEVDPKKYRFRILSVGNDRMLNLSLVMAASKNSNTTAETNAGSNNAAVLCDGTNNVNPADCTEVKMVPFTATQNTSVPFPPHWYSKQKGGVTFDGRPSGVFDPRTRGPQMVQIGTEGGFLSSPVAIPNQPVNYEYNPKNILIGNIKEHALLLAPAERADVVVDFSKFAGSTLILYNDAGAPVPAWDLRLDYYTGNFDNTDTGGAFSVIPGYGPNSRTLMQIRVSNNGGTNSHPVDDLGDIANLTNAVHTAFKTSQEPIIVPQSTYNETYGINATDALGQDLSRISDNTLSYWPLNTTALPYALVATTVANKVTLELEPKTIIEDWTMNWGRMNALLGTEVPHTTAINQTSIPQAFVDPPTDIVKITPNDNMVPISGTLPDGTQIWKITHNGVDSHGVHFHLFHVQVVNRVGWDGAVYPPDANELGWKDTVRMNPLSDTIVALRPMSMELPFKVPNSHRLIHPKLANGANSNEFFNFSPLTGNGSNVRNLEVNYGWEYLWHCHILGHEENDMMRSIAVAQPPETPTGLTAIRNGADVTLNWTDNSIISNWVTIQRATDSGFSQASTTTFSVPVNECADQTGCARTWTDTSAPAVDSLYYRIMANNTVGAGDGKLDAPRNPDGSYGAFLPTELSSLTPGFTDYAHVTANSNWSDVSGGTINPKAVLSSATLDFGGWLAGTSSAVKTITLSNTGISPLIINGITAPAGFAQTNNCGSALAANTSCIISVRFTAGTGSNSANLTITDNSNGVANSIQTVNLTGNGVIPATPSLNAALLTAPPAGVALNWTASSSIVAQPDSYQVQRTAASTSTTLNCATATYANLNSATSSRSVIDTTTSANKTYCYRVMATNAAGSFTSAGVRITLPIAPAAPTLPVISNVQKTSLTLSWTASVGTLVPLGYEVQRCSGLNATAASCTASWVTVGTVTTTTYNATGLVAGTPYVFRIRAYTGQASSGWLNSAMVAYPVAMPNSYTATSNTSTTQSITGSTINVLPNDLPNPSGISGRTASNVSSVTHTGGDLGGATPATATTSVTTGGAVTLTLTSPAANTTSALKQASKRGTYTFTYTESFGGLISDPTTVTFTVN